MSNIFKIIQSNQIWWDPLYLSYPKCLRYKDIIMDLQMKEQTKESIDRKKVQTEGRTENGSVDITQDRQTEKRKTYRWKNRQKEVYTEGRTDRIRADGQMKDRKKEDRQKKGQKDTVTELKISAIKRFFC